MCASFTRLLLYSKCMPGDQPGQRSVGNGAGLHDEMMEGQAMTLGTDADIYLLLIGTEMVWDATYQEFTLYFYLCNTGNCLTISFNNHTGYLEPRVPSLACQC